MTYITQESIEQATQTPLTTTNNNIQYITQESIDLATQTPLTTTNNDIHYITQESIDLATQTPLTCCVMLCMSLFVVVSGVCVAQSIDSCVM
jgi:hypothetical protein